MVLPCRFVEMLNLQPLLTPVTCFIAQGVEAGAQQTSEAWWKIQSLKFVLVAVLKDKTWMSFVLNHQMVASQGWVEYEDR